MIFTMAKSFFTMTILIGMDEGQAVAAPAVQPEIAAVADAASRPASPETTMPDDAFLWEAETRLLLGLVDGEQALIFENLIARHPAADCA